jgi:multicomponent Na+:H+ antiporter subunit C
VISFAVLAFALVLFHRVYQSVGTDDLDRIKPTEESATHL